MEVATELGSRRLVRIAAVTALLLLRQEVDGHARSPSRNLFLHLGVECQISIPGAFVNRARISASLSRYLVTRSETLLDAAGRVRCSTVAL